MADNFISQLPIYAGPLQPADIVMVNQAIGNGLFKTSQAAVSLFQALASAAAPVQSVAGRTGAVTLSNSDISGLGALATLGVGTGLQSSGGDVSLPAGAAVANIGYTPANEAGDTFTGNILLGGSRSLDGTNRQLQVLQAATAYLSNGSLGAGYFERVCSWTGGASGDSSTSVNGALRGYNQVESTVTYDVECGVYGNADNYSYNAQGLGGIALATSWHGGRVWGINTVAVEQPESFTATAGQTTFGIPNGFTPNSTTVLKNGAVLTGGGVNYTDSSGTDVVLTSGANAGDSITVWRGNPAQSLLSNEADIFVGPGLDTVNTVTGNRIILPLFALRQDTSLNVMAHVGTAISIFAGLNGSDQYVTIDRLLLAKGQFGVGIDLTGVTFSTGPALNLAATQRIAIGSGAALFPLEIEGNTTSMPNGVQTHWVDDTSGSIDVRCGASGTFGIGAVGTYSANDFAIWSQGGLAARYTSSALNLSSGYAYQINGVQVVGARSTGWGDPTGTLSRATFATSSVTLEVLAETVAALITDLTTHGLIGP